MSLPQLLPEKLDQIAQFPSPALDVVDVCPAARVLGRLAVLDAVHLRVDLLDGAVEARAAKDQVD